MEKTSIQISSQTLERMKGLKRYERQSYDELINSMINEIDEETLSKDEIEEIKIALEEVKRGEVYPIEKVAQNLGIKLN